MFVLCKLVLCKPDDLLQRLKSLATMQQQVTAVGMCANPRRLAKQRKVLYLHHQQGRQQVPKECVCLLNQ
jgi:hypothetical protein